MIIPFTASSMATSTTPSTAFSTTSATIQVPSECNTVLVISDNISPGIETHTARSYIVNLWEADRVQYTT